MSVLNCYSPNFQGLILMKNALNNQVGMLGDMFLWLVANLKQGVIYFIKQAGGNHKIAWVYGAFDSDGCMMPDTCIPMTGRVKNFRYFLIKIFNSKYAYSYHSFRSIWLPCFLSNWLPGKFHAMPRRILRQWLPFTTYLYSNVR